MQMKSLGSLFILCSLLGAPLRSQAILCRGFVDLPRSSQTRRESARLEDTAQQLLGRLLIQNDRHLPRRCKGATCTSVSLTNIILVLAETYNPGILLNRPFMNYDIRFTSRSFDEISVAALHRLLIEDVLREADKKLTAPSERARNGARIDDKAVTEVIKKVYERYFGKLPVDLGFTKLSPLFLADPQVSLSNDGVFLISVASRSRRVGFRRRLQESSHALFMFPRPSLDQGFVVFDPIQVNYPRSGFVRNESQGVFLEQTLIMGLNHSGFPPRTLNQVTFIDFLGMNSPFDLQGYLQSYGSSSRTGTVTLVNGFRINDASILYLPNQFSFSIHTDLGFYRFSPSKIHSIEI